MHGGISPNIEHLDSIRTIDRFEEVPNQKCAFSDILWSDPSEDIDTIEENPRGAGVLFGEKLVSQFLHKNGVSSIFRSHQLAMNGYHYSYNNKVTTIWSAPNYCYTAGNKAAIAKVGHNNTTMVPFDKCNYQQGDNEFINEAVQKYFNSVTK